MTVGVGIFALISYDKEKTTKKANAGDPNAAARLRDAAPRRALELDDKALYKSVM